MTGVFQPHEARQERRLRIVTGLVAIFFVFELAGALVARSNVLEATAVHLLMDVFALATNLVGMRVAVRRPTSRFTFGLRRVEPVVAIFNAGLVLAVTVEIVAHAIHALKTEARPEAGIMLAVAVGALLVNGASAWLLHGVIHPGHHHGHEHGHEKGHDLNLRGARLHLLVDALGSVAALVAALVLRFGGPAAADPIASFFVAAALVVGATSLLRDAVLVLLEAAPKHLDVEAIRTAIGAQPDVLEVHELHVWSLGAGHDAIVAHVRAARPNDELGGAIARRLRELYAVEHVTVQVDPAANASSVPASGAPDEDLGDSGAKLKSG